MERLSPDTDEDRLTTQDELSKRRLRDQESVDELARDIEKLLDKASPGLPADARDMELRFHLTTALPEKIAFQLKLLPRQTYHQTIAKARELRLIFRRAIDLEPVNQVDISPSEQRLEKLEEAVFQVSEQLASIGTRRPKQQSIAGVSNAGDLVTWHGIAGPCRHGTLSASGVGGGDT